MSGVAALPAQSAEALFSLATRYVGEVASTVLAPSSLSKLKTAVSGKNLDRLVRALRDDPLPLLCASDPTVFWSLVDALTIFRDVLGDEVFVPSRYVTEKLERAAVLAGTVQAYLDHPRTIH